MFWKTCRFNVKIFIVYWHPVEPFLATNKNKTTKLKTRTGNVKSRFCTKSSFHSLLLRELFCESSRQLPVLGEPAIYFPLQKVFIQCHIMSRRDSTSLSRHGKAVSSQRRLGNQNLSLIKRLAVSSGKLLHRQQHLDTIISVANDQTEPLIITCLC